jgi:hypothetical protein
MSVIQFTYSAACVIGFGRDRDEGELPSTMDLLPEGDWWFGDRADWRDRVSRFVPAGLVEPNEPLLAYELACLRWTDGADVLDVALAEEVVTISFRNGARMSIENAEVQGDPGWVLRESGVLESHTNWSVACDGTEYFVRSPS